MVLGLAQFGSSRAHGDDWWWGLHCILSISVSSLSLPSSSSPFFIIHLHHNHLRDAEQYVGHPVNSLALITRLSHNLPRWTQKIIWIKYNDNNLRRMDWTLSLGQKYLRWSPATAPFNLAKFFQISPPRFPRYSFRPRNECKPKCWFNCPRNPTGLGQPMEYFYFRCFTLLYYGTYSSKNAPKIKRTKESVIHVLEWSGALQPWPTISCWGNDQHKRPWSKSEVISSPI